MEPADDLATGRRIDPEIYVPKTLSSLLVEEPWLALSECVRIGIALADAVAALHHVGLVHRDIKPSNIIFVNGAPKLADIGLVAKAELPKSFGGTEGFIPSTNIGTPRADIFSLGRLLYQAATGAPPSRHPSLPTSLMEREDAQDLMRLMELINKACSETSGDYYSSAAELRDDLLALQSMLNPRRARSRAASTRSEPQLH
jgi:serine/threonine protein kinase